MTDSNTYSEEMVDFDIWYFRGKLAKAQANNDQAAITKITKQIELLEDAVIIYKMTREQ